MVCEAISEGLKPSIHPNTLYWLAGILEGEGSFITGPPSNLVRIAIQIQMTDKDIIDKVASIWKSSVFIPRKRIEHYKQTYTTRVRGKKARKWMELLLPLMGQRRQIAIRKAMEAFDTKMSKRFKLKEGDIEEIKRLISTGITHAKIADKFGVSRSHITYIGLGKVKQSYRVCRSTD